MLRHADKWNACSKYSRTTGMWTTPVLRMDDCGYLCIVGREKLLSSPASRVGGTLRIGICWSYKLLPQAVNGGNGKDTAVFWHCHRRNKCMRSKFFTARIVCGAACEYLSGTKAMKIPVTKSCQYCPLVFRSDTADAEFTHILYSSFCGFTPECLYGCPISAGILRAWNAVSERWVLTL